MILRLEGAGRIQPGVLYVYSEVFGLKPTSALWSGCLKSLAHLSKFFE